MHLCNKTHCTSQAKSKKQCLIVNLKGAAKHLWDEAGCPLGTRVMMPQTTSLEAVDRSYSSVAKKCETNVDFLKMPIINSLQFQERPKVTSSLFPALARASCSEFKELHLWVLTFNHKQMQQQFSIFVNLLLIYKWQVPNVYYILNRFGMVKQCINYNSDISNIAVFIKKNLLLHAYF